MTSLLRHRISRYLRLAGRIQLMPILESGDDPLIGGQAVIEGVMMRAPHSYCIAVRRPDGEIVTREMPISRPSERHKVLGWPVVRGLATLGQAMSLGLRALRFSANESLTEEEKEAEVEQGKKPAEFSGWLMALNVIVSLGFFITLYKFLPLLAVTGLRERFSWLDSSVAFSATDGVIRLGIFLTFIFLVSRLKDIRRVFEYHGAEHKVVFNYESGDPVEVERAQQFATFHPRCGTSFLMVVMFVSIAAYALVPFEGFGMQFLSRIVLLPVIGGVSYEVIRFAAKRGEGVFRWLVAPGLWLQRITTQKPADDQVEVSIRALQGAMALEEKQEGELVLA